MIVVDASYVLALVLPDESRPASFRLVARERLATPAIWPLEMANAMRSNLRRGRLRLAEVDGLLQQVAELQVDVVVASHAQPRRHLESALLHQLTPYDATYLELAMQWSCPLATCDAALRAAAEKAGLLVYS